MPSTEMADNPELNGVEIPTTKMADFNHLVKMGYNKRAIAEAMQNSEDIRSAINYMTEINQTNVKNDALKDTPRNVTTV